MRPSFANLITVKNVLVSVDLGFPKPGASMLEERKCAASLSGSGGALALKSGDGDPPGMWVHYLQGKSAFGIAQGGETWAASGPFSGCHIIVGKKDGQIYVAHIAHETKEQAVEADQAWAGRGWRDEVWGRWKVSAPSGDFNCNSIVFVDWSGGTAPNAISVVRLDLKTKSMGGFDKAPMEVFGVEHLVSPAK